MRLAVTEVWSLVDGSSEKRETVVLLADHHTALPLEDQPYELVCHLEDQF